MFLWITANLATIIISLALACIVALIIVGMIKNKKAGKSSCGCNCSNCHMSENCQQKNGNNNTRE